MRNSARSSGFAAILLVLAAAGSIEAEEIKARGVNPAENDTRADVILKY